MNITYIRELVGDITEEQIRHIDSYVIKDFAIFIPATGQCGYATMENHTHPAYSFILSPNAISISGDIIEKDLNQDSLIVMSPDFKHHEDPIEDFVRYFAIFISKDYFEEILRGYTNIIPYYENSHFKVSTDLIPIIKSYIVEYRDRFPGYSRQLILLKERITHLIIRNCLDMKSSIKNISNRFEVESAIEYIHSNYMKKLTVNDICKSVNYSTSTFPRLFKKELGINLSGYIIDIRLKKAKKLLEKGRLSIIDIAYACGFNSPSHLSATFKKSFGDSPSNYQKIVGKKAEF